MKVFCMAAVIMLVASPAFAQSSTPSLNLLMDNKPAKSQDEKDAEAARDKAYQDFRRRNTGRQGACLIPGATYAVRTRPRP